MQDIVAGARSVRGRGVGKGEWFPEKIKGEGVWQKFVCKRWGRHGKQLKMFGPGAAFALSLK